MFAGLYILAGVAGGHIKKMEDSTSVLNKDYILNEVASLNFWEREIGGHKALQTLENYFV